MLNGPVLTIGAAVLAVSGVGYFLYDSPAQIQGVQGLRIYAEHCAGCHGAKLGGQPDWKKRKADGRLPAPPHDGTVASITAPSRLPS